VLQLFKNGQLSRNRTSFLSWCSSCRFGACLQLLATQSSTRSTVCLACPSTTWRRQLGF